MPIQPLYLAVHNEANQLEAYWHLRQFERGWLMTARLPGSESIIIRRHHKPTVVVSMFYDFYTAYLTCIVDELNKMIAELPTVEVVRDGFRPGWLAKRRRALVSRRAELICSGRNKYAEAITMLRQRGWPTPAPKPLVFDGFDAYAAGPTAYVSDQNKPQTGHTSQAFTHRIGEVIP